MGTAGGTAPPCAWYRDPLVAEPRNRWWAGDHWTAWVVDVSVVAPSLSWTPELADTLPPIRWGQVQTLLAPVPPLEWVRASDSWTSSGADDDAAPPRRAARRALLAVAVVCAVLFLAAATSTALLTFHPHRGHSPPTTPPRTATRP